MTKNDTGGWILTTLIYALGGRMETPTATRPPRRINNPQTKQALQKLHDMRWDDNSHGRNFLLDWSGINQAFAAGQIGMYMGGSDVYTSLVQQNNIKPADYGLAALPLHRRRTPASSAAARSPWSAPRREADSRRPR